MQVWIDPISRYLHHSTGQHGPAMLMYHSVAPGKSTPDWRWAISMQRFQNHLDFLAAEGWATLTMSELIHSPEKLTGRTVAITFDDGYADNLAAWEELQKRNMRATLFMVSGAIARTPTWPSDGRPAGDLLGPNELRAMHASGMEIGSHTVNHTRLTEASDIQLHNELADSRMALEDTLGTGISSLAYPYGLYDTRCINAAREAGYHGACTTRSGWALRDGDPHQLRRLTVFNTDTTSRLARKLYFGSNDVSWLTVSRHTLQRAAIRMGRRTT